MGNLQPTLKLSLLPPKKDAYTVEENSGNLVSSIMVAPLSQGKDTLPNQGKGPVESRITCIHMGRSST